jgi:hypothetical protein
MTTTDIELTLERWFDDGGPDRVAERVVDSALATAATTGQRRGWGWRLGRTSQVGRGRLLALAAAVAAIGLIGAVAVSGAIRPGPTTPPETSAPPSAMPSKVPTAVAGNPFVSGRYAYSIEFPERCGATFATGTWTWPSQWDAGPAIDTYVCGQGRLAVVSAEVPFGVTSQGWVDALRGRTIDGRCPAGGDVSASDQPEFVEDDVAGRPGFIRFACGHVDGVTFVGRRAYLFGYQGALPLNGNRHAFRALVERAEFPAAVAAVPPSWFASDLYGYTVAVPEGWTQTPADRPWLPGNVPPPAALSDTFVAPAGIQVHIISAAIPAGISEEAWAERYLGVAEAGRLNPCRYPSDGSLAILPRPWRELSVDGHPGRVRASCGEVQGFVVFDDRAYVITAHGPYVFGTASDETIEAFYSFVDQMTLQPEEAVDIAGG